MPHKYSLKTCLDLLSHFRKIPIFFLRIVILFSSSSPRSLNFGGKLQQKFVLCFLSPVQNCSLVLFDFDFVDAKKLRTRIQAGFRICLSLLPLSDKEWFLYFTFCKIGIKYHSCRGKRVVSGSFQHGLWVSWLAQS